MSNQQKTLIILTPAFPANEQDSVWVPSKQLFVKKLKENFPGINIIVLSFNYPFHLQTYSVFNVQVTAFNGLKTRKIKRLLLWLKVYRTIKHIKKENPIIGIYSFWCSECAWVGSYFARRHHLPHFCWISGFDAQKENKFVKRIRPKPGELVAMSLFLQNEFYKNHAIKPAHVIPIGIDPADFSSSSRRDIDILGAGSLSGFKQYDVFIRIIKNISAVFPSIKAVICGDGSEMENLKQLVRRLQLENNITLAGVKSHNETLQYMSRAKLFLHPSSYEGFGAVNLEALYAGAYVISFCDPMQVKEERWYRATDAADMEAKAIEWLNNPDKKYTPTLLYNMNDTAKAVMNLFTNRS